MFSVRELIKATRGFDAPAFEKQIGPFALMQRPPSDLRIQQGKAAGVGSTAPIPLWSEKAPAPVEFEALQVARLPPPQANGLMRLVIGRSPECELVLEDSAVSNLHAAIHWNGTAGVLIELGSSNGTFVNDKKVPGDVILSSGDQLSFGRSHFIYYLSAELHQRVKRLAGLG